MISLCGKLNKTRKYILSFFLCIIKQEIEDDWEILEEEEQKANPLIGYKESLQREEIIEKDNTISIEQEIKRKMSSSPITFQGSHTIDPPHFVLSNY